MDENKKDFFATMISELAIAGEVSTMDAAEVFGRLIATFIEQNVLHFNEDRETAKARYFDALNTGLKFPIDPVEAPSH